MRQGRRKLAHGADSRHVGEFVALALNHRGRLFFLSSVHRGADPFAHGPVGRKDRHGLHVKMSIAPIASAYLAFIFVGAFVHHRLLPQSLAAFSILGVKRL